MNKFIFGTLIIILLLLSNIGIAQVAKSDSIIILIDSINVEYIVFADSETGILIKKNKQIVTRKIKIKKTYPYYLSEQIEEPEFFDKEKKRIDWIIYKVGNQVYSVVDYGNLSNMLFKNEAFHKAP